MELLSEIGRRYWKFMNAVESVATSTFLNNHTLNPSSSAGVFTPCNMAW